MIKKIPVSVGILTFNSERVLSRALESVRDIIICDGGSTGRHARHARRSGAHIIEQDDAFAPAIGAVTPCAQSMHCGTASLFLLYRLRRRPRQVSNACAHRDGGTEDGYRIPIRKDRRRVIEHSSNYPGYQYRTHRPRISFKSQCSGVLCSCP